MSLSSVPIVQITDAGVVLPQDSEILAGTLADINAAFGNQLNTDSVSTPQYQLATSNAAIISAMNDVFALFVALVDPETSSGAMQDALGKIYFLTRYPAAPTVVTANCGGASGTVIPAGSLAVDRNTGKIYSSTETVTIPAGGSVSAVFECQETGPIVCAASSLDIYQAISGWDTVNNPSAGVVGRDVESPQEFEYRRRLSVALNAQGSTDAIRANVLAIPDVLDVFVVDNPSHAAVDYGATAYSLAPHSVYVGVVGGSDEAVAQAIWPKKDLGCNMNGNTTVTVIDPAYDYPQPNYDITFNRPTNTPIKFAINIQNNPRLPANIIELVRNAVMLAFVGADGGQRARMGGIVFASRYYQAISSTSPYVVIRSVLVGTVTADQPLVEIGIDQEPTLTANDIAVNLV